MDLSEISDINRSSFVVGIVPVAEPKLGFDMPWSDCLFPVGNRYMAIENAVYNCVLAGCDNIWLVCHYGIEPIIRHRIGDVVNDPFAARLRKNRSISVFYIPVQVQDRKYRDSLTWSILYGSHNVNSITKKISTWVMPEKFYCSFPHCMLPEEFTARNRKNICKSERMTFIYDGKTVKDNLRINFTYTQKDLQDASAVFKNEEIINYSSKNKNLDFSLKNIFRNLDMDNTLKIEPPWHYDISSWENYCSYLGTDYAKNLRKDPQAFERTMRKYFLSKSKEVVYFSYNTKQLKESIKILDEDDPPEEPFHEP